MVLMALSRKTCIGDMTGCPVQERLYGTLAADMVAVQAGASMVRVHDVKAAVDTLHVLSYLS
jgi:dihydropteroate synthase